MATEDSLCQVCAGSARDFFYERDGIRLLSCRSCKLVLLDPLPTLDQIARIYNNHYDGATTGYFLKVEKKLRRSRLRMAQIKRYVSGGRFLDIGCNGGFMVEAAREAGFEAFGVDLDPTAIAYARNHYPKNTYFLGSIENFAKTDSGFSAIYCSEVIEHVLDLNSFVAAIAETMKP